MNSEWHPEHPFAGQNTSTSWCKKKPEILRFSEDKKHDMFGGLNVKKALIRLKLIVSTWIQEKDKFV